MEKEAKDIQKRFSSRVRAKERRHGTATPRQPGSSILNPDTTRHPDVNNTHQPTTKREKRQPTRATSIQKGNSRNEERSSRTRTIMQYTHNNSHTPTRCPKLTAEC